MKASELITQLQKAIEEVGDMDVVMPTEAIPYDEQDAAWAEISTVAWGDPGDMIILCDPSLADSFSPEH